MSGADTRSSGDSRTAAGEPGSEPGAADPRRILVLVTRDVGGRTTGRVMVLRTHLEALATLGHEVTVAVVAPSPPEDTAWTRRFPTVHIRSPRPPSMMLSAARALISRKTTLNEALFVDGRVRRDVAALAEQERPDVVVLDSLRLATATARMSSRPATVLDLDDLLSLRYERMHHEGVADPVAVLGFAAQRIPSVLRPVAARGAVALLGAEARRVAARETSLVESADVVSLVSRDEVDLLRSRSGTDVAWLPPAVSIPGRPAGSGEGLVFLGGLDYLPNVMALRLYRDEVLPHLDPDDAGQVLHVVGHVPDAVRAELDVPGIRLHGYVDDLASGLRRSLMVAPLATGGGVKLKVLDGMAHGVPVVGLPGAFEGLGLRPELRGQADDGKALAVLIRELLADPERREEMGLAARAFVTENFSAAAAAGRWNGVLDRLRPDVGTGG